MSKEAVTERDFIFLKTERVTDIESEQKPSMGMALAIVGIDSNRNGENISNPSLWTNIELKSKPETERVRYQISIPSDTKKRGESICDNMLGTLAEFSGNNDLIRSLILMPSSFADRAIRVKGNSYDLMVAILNGFTNIPIAPFDKNEVAANGWMKLRELQRLQKEDPLRLRSFIGQVVGGEKSNEKNMVRKVISNYFNNPEERIPLSTILSPSFSIEDFYKQREQLHDVIGSSGVVYSSKR